ncbi:MAG: hypothetical protein FWF52_05825 [Candidatus Azobacteroides sp.]|nr:hypothetical protein [Candidatus Azobacteroides sp.]
MAEEELIREHAKHALQSLTDKKKRGKERISDFLWEVFIIIVAVNITLWFHNWSEKRQERELEKNFLIGTRNDLGMVKERLGWFDNFQPILDYYDSIWVQMNEHRIDTAFIDANSQYLISTQYFTYDNSRFESFKFSGYLRLIENPKLSEEITRLYTVEFPNRVGADGAIFGDRRNNFTTYIGSKAPIDSSGKMHVSKLLNDPGAKFHLYLQKKFLQEMKSQKQDLRQEVDNVMNLIDKELKNRFNYKEKES